VSPIDFLEIPGVIDSNVCLKPLITQQSIFLLRLHKHYENGMLPYSGGLLDQSAVFIEAMEVIGDALQK